jgi:hypothetical protein
LSQVHADRASYRKCCGAVDTGPSRWSTCVYACWSDRSTLLPATFAALASPVLQDIAADCVVDMLNTYFNPLRDFEMMQALTAHILLLQPA